MNSIVNDLQYAQRSGSLVNVYQVNAEIVYTGYVFNVDENGIVIRTFDDSGTPDGQAYMAFNIIETVEFSGTDLDNMEYRIAEAEADDEQTLGETAMTFKQQSPLVYQVVERALTEHGFLVLTLRGSDDYVEGRVTQLSDSTFTFDLFDKFQLDHRERLTLSYDDIVLAEFGGRELSAQKMGASRLAGLRHVDEFSVAGLGGIVGALQDVQKSGALVSVVPKSDPEMFYVGRVNTLNDDAVVLNLIDMSGRFGGYWLANLNAIEEVIVRSDYLQVVNILERVMVALGEETPMQLNNERLFDATTDLFQTVLEQAATFKRIIRIRTRDDGTLVGYLSQMGANQFIFHQVVVGQVMDAIGSLVLTKDVSEIAFEYVEANLIERQLKAQGDL